MLSPTESPISAPQTPERSARLVAHNLRRLMARDGMTYEDVITATGLDGRTIRAIVRNNATPQARTLRRLAEGFGVATDELFAPPAGLTPEAFDAATNPVVDRVKSSYPEIFRGWTANEFAELASRFGVGGELTESGAIDEANKMNTKRSVMKQVQVVMETAHADLLTEFVNLLYERVRISE